MRIEELNLVGAKRIIPKVFEDHRGFFLETYVKSRYEKGGILDPFVQDNHSFSQFEVLRGMHVDRRQAKLVRVCVGKIYDVIVDMRPDSPTYKQWQGFELDGDTHHQIYIPPGCAHGFCVLSPNAHVAYKVNAEYDPSLERHFRFDDPDIGIKWPISTPKLSDKDAHAPFFRGVKL